MPIWCHSFPLLQVRPSSKLPVLDREGLARSFTKLDVRTIMKYLVLEGKNPQQIHKELSEHINDVCVDIKTVKRWVNSFQLGKVSVDDKPRTGRPSTGRSNEHIKSIEDLIKDDPKITIQKMADLTGVTKTTIHRIIHVDLGKRWIMGKWITRVLSDEEKIERSAKKAQKGAKLSKKEQKNAARAVAALGFSIGSSSVIQNSENRVGNASGSSSPQPTIQPQAFPQSFSLYGGRPAGVVSTSNMPSPPPNFMYPQHFMYQKPPPQHFSPPQPPF